MISFTTYLFSIWGHKNKHPTNSTKLTAFNLIVAPFLFFLSPGWRPWKNKPEEVFHQVFFLISLLKSN